MLSEEFFNDRQLIEKALEYGKVTVDNEGIEEELTTPEEIARYIIERFDNAVYHALETKAEYVALEGIYLAAGNKVDLKDFYDRKHAVEEWSNYSNKVGL